MSWGWGMGKEEGRRGGATEEEKEKRRKFLRKPPKNTKFAQQSTPDLALKERRYLMFQT